MRLSSSTLHWHPTAHRLHLSIENPLRFFKFLHIGTFLLLIHAVVPLCSHSHNVWSSHVGILFLDLHTLALNKQIIGISGSFGYKRLLVAFVPASLGNLLDFWLTLSLKTVTNGFFAYRNLISYRWWTFDWSRISAGFHWGL